MQSQDYLHQNSLYCLIKMQGSRFSFFNLAVLSLFSWMPADSLLLSNASLDFENGIILKRNLQKYLLRLSSITSLRDNEEVSLLDLRGFLFSLKR